MSVDEKTLLDSYPQIAPESAGTGHPGHLTPEQEKALNHLRDLLTAHGHTERMDDATLLRFLRARKFDVGKAMEMYQACEKWREEFGTNTILEDFTYPEKGEVMKYYPQFYHKTDKDGRPVYYELIGNVDIHAMYKITTQERMLRNLVWEYEAFTHYRLPACSRKVGALLETSCTVIDLKDVSLSTASHVYGYIKEASHIGQNYYPERMGQFYVINAPFGFSAIWSFIRHFLDPVTVEKIHIYGSKYQKSLMKQIPEENLPVQLGGKSQCKGNIYLADDGPWRDPKYIGPEGPAPLSAAESKASSAQPADAAAAPTKVEKVKSDDSLVTAPEHAPA
ncbi:SEC14 cytosolic factor [Wickerhamiella sorbophila]|uniref:SEC14 cytosolic factor n=1 Tax=Wickerhamiella sorbophila TaxID=45607 RepID=A0A2T0FIU4_9ASCO|nr:SEC14 cytosolic factor [Wickerhamiella sorbophila]PRT54859.1 SEC14 cytosolic factor [Wickerhamiella sorbophila]